MIYSHLHNRAEEERGIRALLLLLPVLSIVSHSLIVDRGIILFFFLICIKLGLKERYIINPYFLFSIVPLSLLIYFNVGNAYMLDLTHSTWLLSIINIAAFLLANIITSDFRQRNNCIGPPSRKSLYIWSFVFYLFSFLGKFIPLLASVLWIFSIPSIVCAMKTRDKRMLVLVAVVIVSSFLGVTSKMSVLIHVLTILICYERYYISSKKQKIMMVVWTGVAVVFMIFAFSFANKDRGYYDSESGLDYYSRQGADWSYDSNLFMPYMYLTTPWANLQYVTETQDYRTYGLWTFKPILGYLGLDNNYEQVYVQGLVPYSTFNTFTFIACGFKDFGFWGSIIVSLLLGFFVKKIYTRYRLSRSPFDVASYICVALAVAEMFFSNHFLMQSYPFTCFILMEMMKLLFRTSSYAIEAESI